MNTAQHDRWSDPAGAGRSAQSPLTDCERDSYVTGLHREQTEMRQRDGCGLIGLAWMGLVLVTWLYRAGAYLTVYAKEIFGYMSDGNIQEIMPALLLLVVSVSALGIVLVVIARFLPVVKSLFEGRHGQEVPGYVEGNVRTVAREERKMYATGDRVDLYSADDNLEWYEERARELREALERGQEDAAKKIPKPDIFDSVMDIVSLSSDRRYFHYLPPEYDEGLIEAYSLGWEKQRRQKPV